MWLGYRSWPADATSTDKALLIGMTHAVVPIMH
jgi:ABC-type spermidine/putrescine transport system permease subunit I